MFDYAANDIEISFFVNHILLLTPLCVIIPSLIKLYYKSYLFFNIFLVHIAYYTRRGVDSVTESDGPPLVSSVIELRHSYGRLLHLKQEIVSTEGWAYSAAAVTLLCQRLNFFLVRTYVRLFHITIPPSYRFEWSESEESIESLRFKT